MEKLSVCAQTLGDLADTRQYPLVAPLFPPHADIKIICAALTCHANDRKVHCLSAITPCTHDQIAPHSVTTTDAFSQQDALSAHEGICTISIHRSPF